MGTLYLSDATFVSETEAVPRSNMKASMRGFSQSSPQLQQTRGAELEGRRDVSPRGLLREWERHIQPQPDPRPPLELARTAIKRLETENLTLQAANKQLAEKLRSLDEQFHAAESLQRGNFAASASSMSTVESEEASYGEEDSVYLNQDNSRNIGRSGQRNSSEQHFRSAPRHSLHVPEALDHGSSRCCDHCQREMRAAARKAHKFAQHTLTLQAELIESHSTILSLLTERQQLLLHSPLSHHVVNGSIGNAHRSSVRSLQSDSTPSGEEPANRAVQSSGRSMQNQAVIHHAQQDDRTDRKSAAEPKSEQQDEQLRQIPSRQRTTSTRARHAMPTLRSDSESDETSEAVDIDFRIPPLINSRRKFEPTTSSGATESTKAAQARLRTLEQERQKLKAEFGLDSSVVEI